ncbi:MAG: hypothetical protein CM1200mP2_00150 [Planctomycetaceae bacterium]|nr:MAG: hypothetical protein CM1200mP2_00150 [Planctomycetaceae bacterium]
MTAGEHVECDFGGSLQVDELIAGQQHMAKCRPGVGGLGVLGRVRGSVQESRAGAKVRGGGRAPKHLLAEPVNSFGVIGGLAGQDRPGQPAAGLFDQSLLSRNGALGATVVLAGSRSSRWRRCNRTG